MPGVSSCLKTGGRCKGRWGTGTTPRQVGLGKAGSPPVGWGTNMARWGFNRNHLQEGGQGGNEKVPNTTDSLGTHVWGEGSMYSKNTVGR